jgi:hypothetical protein
MSDNIIDEINQLQKMDPLKEAEKISGESYKTCTMTSMMGFSIQMNKSKKMAELLDKMNDVKFGEKLNSYIAKITTFGFEEVFKMPFKNDRNALEHLYAFFEPSRGILLIFDTYNGDGVNGGNMYYQVAVDHSKPYYKASSSGGFITHNKRLACFDNNYKQVFPKLPDQIYDYSTQYDQWSARDKEIDDIIYSYLNIYTGHHDCREAVIHNISELEKMGSFVPNWVQPDHVYLMHYMDWKQTLTSEQVDELCKKRMSMLPESVQIQIGFKQ